MRFMICVVAVVLLSAVISQAVETSVDERGVFYVDGQACVPLSVWMQPAYLFELNKYMGVQCIFNPLLDNRSGAFTYDTDDVYDLVRRYQFGAFDHYREGLLNESSIWGWMSTGVDSDRPERVARQTAEIRSSDTSRIVINNISIHDFMDDTKADGYRQALKHTDAVICHVWPEQFGKDNRDIRNVVKFMQRIREYCKDRPGGEVSVWVDIDPHEWSVKNKYDGHYNPAPTRAEFRFQFWASLIHGADAICLFPISFDPFVFNQIPAQNMQEIARNAKLLKRVEMVLASEESSLDIKISGDSARGIVDWTTREYEGEHYIFLINGEQRQQEVSLAVDGLGGKWRLYDMVVERFIDVDGSSHSENLGGLALRIWKLVDADNVE